MVLEMATVHFAPSFLLMREVSKEAGLNLCQLKFDFVTLYACRRISPNTLITEIL